MIPRFANPHATLEKTQIVSRKTLYAEGDEGEHSQPDLSKLDELNEVVRRTLPPVRVEGREIKRGRIQVENAEANLMEEAVLFRLISNGPPVSLSLEPRPEPYMKVREPEVEDNEIQAEERRRQAVAVAVDVEWIRNESLKTNYYPFTQSTIIPVALPTPLTPAPSLMVLSHNKRIRKTRPPVDRKLLEYPYDAYAKPQPIRQPKRSYDCPVFDLNYILGENKDKRRRRRKRNVKKVEHRYWQPDPSVKGKCMGYAMGYTSRRDKMRG